ncbi:MAG TPA: hypothetical protein DD727_06385 [Clostridiales bacterium]|nr:hypothetical protein [Clostridiales bacterium]
MERIFQTLKDLKPGDQGTILQIRGTGVLKRRLTDMGLTPGTTVFVRKVAPLGDPMEILLRNYILTLRKNEAERIIVQKQWRWTNSNGRRYGHRHHRRFGRQSQQRQDNSV